MDCRYSERETAQRQSLFLIAEDISLAVAGVDQFLVKTLVDLVAQVGDVDIDDVGSDFIIGVIRCSQMSARETTWPMRWAR